MPSLETSDVQGHVPRPSSSVAVSNACSWIAIVCLNAGFISVLILLMFVAWIIGFVLAIAYLCVLSGIFFSIRKSRIRQAVEQSSEESRLAAMAAAEKQFNAKESCIALLLPIAVAITGLFIPLNFIVSALWDTGSSFYVYQFDREMYLQVISSQLPLNSSTELYQWAFNPYNSLSARFPVWTKSGGNDFQSR